MPTIHPTAIVSPEAQLADDVVVGPFALIDGPAVIGPGCSIGARATISGKVVMGSHNQIGTGSIIGGIPQDLGYDPSIDSGLVMGDGNRVFEYVTLHRSASEGGNSVFGSENFLMTQCHFGHDCLVGDKNVVANAALFAGHVTLGSNTFIGGAAVFHQFIHIGDYALAQGMAGLSLDLPPYCIAHKVNELSGLNIIGLRRAGFSGDERKKIKSAYAALFQSELPREEAVALARSKVDDGPALRLIEAVANPSQKGVLRR